MPSNRIISERLVRLPTRAIRDQGEINCCFSCAIGACLEAARPGSAELAPLYHFHFAGGVSAALTGIQESTARATLLSAGICALEKHDLAITALNAGAAPNNDARRDGRSRRPIDQSTGELIWRAVPMSNSQSQWRRRLRRGIPLVAIIAPNPSYRRDARDNGRLLNGSGPLEAILHAVAVIGYSDDQEAFLIQDSRGSFGLEGQWWLPWEFAASPFVVSAVCFSTLT